MPPSNFWGKKESIFSITFFCLSFSLVLICLSQNFVLSFVSLAIALFLGITSIFKLENTNEGLKRVYHDRVLPLVQLKNIAETSSAVKT
jgi:hypothetical protein